MLTSETVVAQSKLAALPVVVDGSTEWTGEAASEWLSRNATLGFISPVRLFPRLGTICGRLISLLKASRARRP